MSRSTLALPAAALTILALAAFRPDGAAPAPAAGRTLVIAVGDTVRLAGTNVACRALVRNGRKVIDCVRAGRLRGSYGTSVSDEGVTVFRMLDGRTGRTVFTARHRGKPIRCG